MISTSNQLTNSTNVQQFETVRKWLVKNQKKYCENDPPSNKTLYHLVLQLTQYQDELLGREVQNPPLTKLPVSICFSLPYLKFDI
jgi:hypothetical protein